MLGARMTARQVLRRRVILIMLIAIPTAFFSIVYLTTGTREVPFTLSSVSEDTILVANERDESMIFMAVATVGFLISFLSLNLIQRNADVHRRLILSGYKPSELLVAHLLFLVAVMVAISMYITLAMLVFFQPERIILLLMGFVLSGFVYGAYGLMIGSIVKGELEGIFFVVLLANIDAGWLQNPVFYSEAQNQEIIRYLPAYYPSQACLISSFTGYSIGTAVQWSLLYGAGIFAVAMTMYYHKMKTR